MRRCLSAALANALVTLAFYPIGTLKVVKQIDSERTPERYYDGVKYEMIGSTVGALIYFEIYDSVRKCKLSSVERVILAPMIATVVASTVRVPVRLLSRKEQVRHNIVGYMPSETLASELMAAYALTLLISVPQNFIKYTCYEMVARAVKNNPLCKGLLAGCASCVLSSVVCSPLDRQVTRLSCNRIGHRVLRRATCMKYYMLHEVVSTSLGHALLELFCTFHLKPPQLL